MIEEARDAVLEVLSGYNVDVWGDAIAAVVSSLFQSKQDAAETAREEADTQALNRTPGVQDRNDNAAAEG